MYFLRGKSLVLKIMQYILSAHLCTHCCVLLWGHLG